MRLHTLTGVASVPAVQALAVGAALWLALFVYCNYALWRDPHGAYFHSEQVYDLGYSAVRRDEARAWIERWQSYDPTSKPTDPLFRPAPQRAGATPALCAAFTTVRRDHPDAARYFSDSVGSMLEGLSGKERAAVSVNVLFANAAGPSQHPDFGAPWLSALVDHAAGYENVTDDEIDELRYMEANSDFQKKGVYDYVYALERCYNETRAPFIAVFEDDIIFAGDWLGRTLLGLQHLATTPVKEGIGWLYLRLFYSETYMTWDAEMDWWYGHLFAAFSLVSVTSATVLVLIRALLRLRGGVGGTASHYPGRRTLLNLRLDLPTIAVLSLIVAPAFTALAFMAGKYNLPMYALRGGSGSVGSMLRGGHDRTLQRDAGVVPMDSQACCSQALVFDRTRVPELIAYLRLRGRGQTDLMIEEYCNKKPLRRFALGEQAVQHLGVKSSRGGGGVQGNSVWAFYFEESRTQDVARRKQKALERIDWSVFERLQGS
ncbi:Integral membrane protein [Coniochaeta hoffmannii]|uniref:Integral membrane protein n=1 Tax=Coniochaeta hoffmannii TaxID=91930 RepID=A0AA38VHA6_9PEZI|nr:Integral membrane protein [Coniochaeta hoffmannii]